MYQTGHYRKCWACLRYNYPASAGTEFDSSRGKSVSRPLLSGVIQRIRSGAWMRIQPSSSDDGTLYGTDDATLVAGLQCRAAPAIAYVVEHYAPMLHRFVYYQ